MPSDAMFKTANTIHRGLLKLSFGKIGWTAGKMPVLELTTTGRKSGKPRSVMLTSPHHAGDTIVVVASRAGDDHHPAWLLNLQENPTVKVKYKGGPDTPMTARVATEEERAELWPAITAEYKGYAGYQEKTEREIPLVMLDPLSD